MFCCYHCKIELVGERSLARSAKALLFRQSVNNSFRFPTDLGAQVDRRQAEEGEHLGRSRNHLVNGDGASQDVVQDGQRSFFTGGS